MREFAENGPDPRRNCNFVVADSCDGKAVLSFLHGEIYTVHFYDTDLAFVHDAAFGEYARRVAPAIAGRLTHAGIRRGTIVELGCGSGITAAELIVRGYDVLGIDASPAMIALARRRAPRGRFRVGRIGTARLPCCSACIAVGEVITYAIDRGHGIAAIERLFGRIHRALEPGGLFLFDFMESADGRKYRGRSHAGEGWAMTVSAATDRSGRGLTRHMTLFRHVNGEFRRSQETHRVRLFEREEIAGALERRGFSVRFQRSLGRVRLLPGDVFAVARKK